MRYIRNGNTFCGAALDSVLISGIVLDVSRFNASSHQTTESEQPAHAILVIWWTKIQAEPDFCDRDVQRDSRCSLMQSNIQELRGRSRHHDDLTRADVYWGLQVQIPSELQPPLVSCWTCQEESRKALRADVNTRVNKPSQQSELEGGVSWGMSWGNPIMHLSEKLNASMWWDKHWLRNGGFLRQLAENCINIADAENWSLNQWHRNKGGVKIQGPSQGPFQIPWVKSPVFLQKCVGVCMCEIKQLGNRDSLCPI